MIRKSCVNVSSALYSGKEKSPLGSGISAEGFDIDYEMIGTDKLNWIVKLKNNKKVWVRKYDSSSLNYEEPLINDVKKDIKIIKEDDEDNECGDNEDDKDNKGDGDIKVKKVVDVKDKKVLDVKDNKDVGVKDIKDVNDKKDVGGVKKKTDYIIFSGHYLNILKMNNTDKLTHKQLHDKTIEEWNRIKKIPAELKKYMDEIKK